VLEESNDTSVADETFRFAKIEPVGHFAVLIVFNLNNAST
jgi:hypothetical protein